MNRAVGLVALFLVAGGCGGDATADLLTRSGTVELVVRNSRFTPSEVQVEAGSTIRFVVRNGDPIDHEFIVGDAAVHDRHRNGTEPHHGDKPGEVSVAGGAVAETTFRFDTPGEVVFACHLPGHYDYGMRGLVRVLATRP